MIRIYGFCSACLLLGAGAWAATPPSPAGPGALRFAQVFSDHVVLQRERPLPVWGWAAPGAGVTVSFGDAAATATAGADGRWVATLPERPASKEPRTLAASSGAATARVADVLVGDVWLCSGQSNMSMSLAGLQTADATRDAAAADLPLVRHFGCVENFADAPAADVKGQWLVCSPRSAGQFCAVGFYFARKVHAETGVPVGIVRSAKGSTTVELWVSQATLLDTPAFGPLAAKMRASLAAWEQAKAAAVEAGVPPDSPDFPPHPFGEKVRRPRCATLYNGMIAPLAPLALRGVVWYQGESNARDPANAAEPYADMLAALIRSWRQRFSQPRLPFYLVQLPGYRKDERSPAGGEPWAVMREWQQKCTALPHTAMAVTIDVGEADDIHPKNKFDVGQRLALLALKREYGKDALVASGPTFRRLIVDGGKARLEFDDAGSGLMVGRKEGRSPAVEDKRARLQRFAVAGAERRWVWADAVIEGDAVVVSAPGVPVPVAVRYAYAANPVGANLYNREGLPAAPFRTDDWATPPKK
jgi:sialate O-acetylesterase